MCGICGTAGFVESGLLDRMVELIRHRGPDDNGVYISPSHQVGLGNCRLSIIDLSPAGHMPMSNEDGSIWITQNGEIYNFPELRQQLERKGHKFRSRSDTEVLIHGYEEWGLDLLQRLNGMFAFALLDLRDNSHRQGPRLLLARDRFGVKPLYYWSKAEKLIFASEIKAILLANEVEARLNLEALHRYLSFLWIPGPATMFAGIEQVPPGHFLSWDGNRAEISPYWQLRFTPAEEVKEQAASEELRTILQGAVNRHLISDVPVGVFLSGGLDSTTILALSSNGGGARRKAFTIAYRSEDAGLEQSADDAKYARRVARHYGADYHEIEVAPAIVDLLPKVVWHLDNPVADPAAIATYLICSAARPDLKVLLSGQGADEVFAGYRVHMSHILAEYLGRVPSALRNPSLAVMLNLMKATKNYIPGVHSGLLMAAHRFLEKLRDNTLLEPEDRYIASRTYCSEAELHKLYNPELRCSLACSFITKEYRKHFSAVESSDFINRMLYVDAKTFLPDLNLAYCDKLSSAASVEVRVPFLDNEVVDFALRLPPELKLKGVTGKHILRRAVSGVVPRDVVRRRKAGFGAPIRKWMRDDLRNIVNDLLSEETIRRRGLFDPPAISKLLAEERAGVRDNAYRIWALITLEIWQRTFIDSAPRMDQQRVPIKGANLAPVSTLL
jgi:asparagine synthase (glutamine-hydrolysing)